MYFHYVCVSGKPDVSFQGLAKNVGTFRASPSQLPQKKKTKKKKTTARIGYATEGALFISGQLSTDAVRSLRKVGVLIRLWKQHSVQARTQTSGASAPGKKKRKEFRLDSNDLGFICAGVSNVGDYKGNA